MEQPLAFVPAVSRRRALALMAASAALAGSGCTRPPRERIYPWAQMPEARPAGAPVQYASAFVRDGFAHGVLVTTQGGRPTKIEGNPAHPSSVGATDVFAQASVLQLWDPDRSSAVAQRLDGAALATSSWAAFETEWRAAAGRFAATRGAGLRIVTGPVTSPTLRAQLRALLQQWPGARWHQHDPLQPRAARDGALLAFGRDVQPVYDFAQARCAVAFACDPFSDGPGAVRHAMDWSAQRAALRERAAELLAVEATPGLFGARADRRIALAPAQIDALVERFAAALAGAAQPVPGFEADLLRAVRTAGAGSLLIGGPALAPRSHALLHSIRQELGAAGRTVRYLEPLAMAPEAGPLAELTRDIEAGAVDALVLLDVNPIYDTPSFAPALARVRFTAHAGLYRDETARGCRWHLPLSHDYERWSDALAHDGSATIVQPAISPLYDTRSVHEILALLAGDDLRDGHALVQRTWRKRFAAGFEAGWHDSLQRGVVRGFESPAVALAAQGLDALLAARAPAPAAQGLTALFAVDPSVHDGRFANNGWLQELPRPFTKLTWDNALLVAPGSAQSLGITTGDIVRARVGTRELQAPVWVLRGQAEGVVTLPLGYGRRAAGRIGNGVGFDAWALRPPDTFSAAIELQATGRRHRFAFTQHDIGQHGRKLARVIEPGERMAASVQPSLYPENPRPDPDAPAWAMTIDLDTCIGCNACTIACQAENNIPIVGKEEVAKGREMHWIRVDRYEPDDGPGSIFQPVPCMHCEKAPCELVCPVGATVHDTEGLNVQVYNRCIGTRFCSQNCPYKVRRFNFLQYSDASTETLKGQRNPNVTVRQRGVMEKCTYCVQRVAQARQQSQVSGRPLAQGDVVTACQAVCPTRAIHFGDLRQPGSAVAADRRSPRHYALLGELNTLPRTTYLARLRRKDAV